MPLCTKLRLTLNFEDVNGSHGVDVMFHHIRPDLRRLLRMESYEMAGRPNLSLEFAEEYRDIMWSTILPAPIDFFLQLEGPNSSRVDAVRLVAILIEDSETTVFLSVSGDGLHAHQGEGEDSELFRAVQALPIVSLSLENLEGWNTWLSYLHSFCPDKDQPETSYTRPFRDVETITLDYEGTYSLTHTMHDWTIHSMLCKRYSEAGFSAMSSSHTTFLGKEYRPPKPLKHVTYKGGYCLPMVRTMVEQLEEILGPGVWEDVTELEESDTE